MNRIKLWRSLLLMKFRVRKAFLFRRNPFLFKPGKARVKALCLLIFQNVLVVRVALRLLKFSALIIVLAKKSNKPFVAPLLFLLNLMMIKLLFVVVSLL